MGMDTARNQWCCATLNEFRTFLKLTRYKSFEGEFPILSISLESETDSLVSSIEWNADPVIANAARELYKDIENLELMPGLSAEEPKPSQAGSGLAPGYTVSRAILSDAASLVRGDRYVSLSSFSLVLSRSLESTESLLFSSLCFRLSSSLSTSILEI